jgi:hypothetical protein
MPARRVSEHVAMYPDWSHDGRYLVFLQARNALGDEDLQLGSVVRAQVLDEDGRLCQPPYQSKELAGTFLNPIMKVRCLGDGRVLFSAIEVTLPTTAMDMPQAISLFAVDPTRQATVTRLIPRSVEGDLDSEWASLFEVSPNGARIAFPGEQGRLSVFELATGQFRPLSSGRPKSRPSGGELVFIPGWRYPDELCLLRWAKEGVAEVVLHSPSAEPETKVISSDWPEEVVEGLLR